jgi:hypothetical protein
MITLFSAQLPTVMNIVADGKQQTFFIKDQIPFVETQITVNIPTPESILNALPVISNPDEFAAIQNRFIQLKQGCKIVEARIQQLIAQIDGVLEKVDRVEQIFGSINGFLSFLSEFIPLLRILNGTMQAVLAAQVFPVASGTITVRAGDALQYVKSKTKEIDALVKLSRSVSGPVFEVTDSIQDELIPLRIKLQEILSEIRARCFYLDSVLIDKLKELELAMAQNPPIGGGITGPNGTGVDVTTEELVNVLSAQFEPEDILNNIENSNKEKVIEYLVENGFTGYQITKK